MAIPGEVLGYFEAKKRFGNPEIPMKDLIEPTIRLCEEGIPVTRSLVRAANAVWERLSQDKVWRQVAHALA